MARTAEMARELEVGFKVAHCINCGRGFASTQNRDKHTNKCNVEPTPIEQEQIRLVVDLTRRRAETERKDRAHEKAMWQQLQSIDRMNAELVRRGEVLDQQFAELARVHDELGQGGAAHRKEMQELREMVDALRARCLPAPREPLV